MTKIRVVIVEDSRPVRELLVHIVNSDARLEVVGAFERAEEALAKLTDLKPDIVSMDIQLPGINGHEATRRIMSEHPLPVIIVTASFQPSDVRKSIQALEAGALTVLEKPVAVTNPDFEAYAKRLCTQLRIMSDVKVVQRRPVQLPTPPIQSAGSKLRRNDNRGSRNVAMVGIVASTGGPGAVVQVLQQIGPDCPVPVLLVQHISEEFSAGFISWLDEVVPLRVERAGDGAIPLPGRVYVALAGTHLRFDGAQMRLSRDPPVNYQRPSGTVLFESMAASLGGRSLGVLLTGMGSDGAAGLKAIYESGGYTIAQDQASSVVYGMPDAAVRLGAVSEQLPLAGIGARVNDLIVGGGRNTPDE